MDQCGPCTDLTLTSVPPPPAAAGLLGCSHARSHQIFVESMRQQSCKFLSFKCDDYEQYLSGSCQTMLTPNLGLIGLENIDMNLNGSYFLQTTAVNEALCRE